MGLVPVNFRPGDTTIASSRPLPSPARVRRICLPPSPSTKHESSSRSPIPCEMDDPARRLGPPAALLLRLRPTLLAGAFAAAALDPRGVAGFYYHPRMVAVVHLVTLGWITASILGALYLVGPMALRLPLPARRGDFAAFGAYAIGVTGMVGHFWLAEPRGMVWGAALVTAALLHVGVRVLRALPAAPLSPVRLPCGL